MAKFKLENGIVGLNSLHKVLVEKRGFSKLLLGLQMMMFAFTKAAAVVLVDTIFLTQVCSYFIDLPVSRTTEQLAKFFWSYDGKVFRDGELPAPSEEPHFINSFIRLVYNKPFKLRNKQQTATFTTDFVLNLRSSSMQLPSTGNVAFILAADPFSPIASQGMWLGIVNASTNGTAEAKIFAIEFDTTKNSPDDVDNNHVALDLNSIHSVLQQPLMEFGVNLSAVGEVFVKVIYDGINISIYVTMSSVIEDRVRNRVIFHPLNLSFLPDDVYVGFSAPIFYSDALNPRVLSWQFYGTDVGDIPRNQQFRVWIMVAIIIIVFLGGGVILLLCIKKKHKLNNLEQTYIDIEDQIQNFSIAPRIQKFGFTKLKKATNNFNPTKKLGRGGFGTVYKGNLMNKEVAIKRISKDSRQGKQEFITEVATIGGLHHKNLVRLIGWCYQNKDLLLVYEYMPNGSLDKLTYNGDALNWETRYNIICGIAEALNYLHNECKKTILHRDIKPSNVMLDSNFEAKLGDFGLARSICRIEQTHHSTREIAGTRGYMAPEIFLTRRATMETDMYAFGILVLEVVCGRKPTNPSELSFYGDNIAHWVWEFHKRGEIVKAADERIEGQYEKEDIERVLILGLACCHPNPHERPTMKSSLQVLKKEANLPDLPREMPLFVWPLNAPSRNDIDNSQQLANSFVITELVGR